MVLVGCSAVASTGQTAQPTLQTTRIRSTPLTIQDQNPFTPEDYAIYSAIMNSHSYRTGPFVIRNHTGLRRASPKEDRLTGIKPELMASFESANKQIYFLQNKFNLQ